MCNVDKECQSENWFNTHLIFKKLFLFSFLVSDDTSYSDEKNIDQVGKGGESKNGLQYFYYMYITLAGIKRVSGAFFLSLWSWNARKIFFKIFFSYKKCVFFLRLFFLHHCSCFLSLNITKNFNKHVEKVEEKRELISSK
jgi:hypothetical protein